jgi:protein-disulfide isomerase
MRLHQMVALAAAAILSIAAGKPAPLSQPDHRNWNAAVAVTPSGSHQLGNPAAAVKLVEYISYTCPHCAAFETQADGPMRLAYVSAGKLQIEVRHYVRDPVDLTVAMLTNCGAPAKFFLNHATFLRSQATWIQPMTNSTPAQRARWSSGDMLTRRRAIASDFHMYEIMQSRGYERVAVDRCLADDAMAQRLAQQNVEADRLGVAGTPSFLLNGQMLYGTHDWSLLQPQLAARF